MDQQHSEWPIFPGTSYGCCLDQTAQSNSSVLFPPLQCENDSVDDWLAKQVSQFKAHGTRQCVGAVIITHQHLQPQLLLLHNPHSYLPIFECNGHITDNDASFIINTTSIPIFEYRKWQTPLDVLSEQLSKAIKYRSAASLEDLSEILDPHLTSILSPTTPLPEVQLHNVAQSDTFIDVSSAPNVKVQTSPEEDLYRDIMSHAASPSLALPIQPLAKGENNKSQTSPLYNPIVGNSLGTWWVAEFGHPPLPYLPAHITRPKLQIRLYQVILPPECDFVFPQSELQLKFISFDKLLSNVSRSLGPAYSSIPQLVSRFALRPMVSRSIDVTPSRSMANSAHASRTELQRHIHKASSFAEVSGQTSNNQSGDHQNNDVNISEPRVSDQQAFAKSIVQKYEEHTTDESEQLSAKG